MRRFLLVLSTIALLTFPAVGSDLHVVAFSGAPPADFAERVARLGGTVEFTHAGASIGAVRGLTDDAAAALRASGGISFMHRDEEFAVAPASMETDDLGVDGTDSPDFPQLASRYPRQWHLRAIGADQAWAAGYLGKPGVTVAVLDTGIAYMHPDLNGRVDLSRSVSFQNGPGTVDGYYHDLMFPTLHPVTDLHYHGTHVAATIASNALAAAGVTSKVTLMGVKVLNVNGRGNSTAIIQGILHAADNGADVINMSLGGAFAKSGNGWWVGYFSRVTNYAFRKGTLLIVSAGNEALDLDHDGNTYKTYCSAPNVVCVSATGPTSQVSVDGPWANVDAVAGYSNYGRSAVSVAAPGGNASAVWAACSSTSLQVPVCRTGTYIIGLAGTSMASPHVAGLAALLVGEIGKGKPAEVRARILKSADDLGPVGTDPFYGRGRISVPRALGLQ